MAKYIGVQFEEEGSLALVNELWITPRKREVFWPPVKNQIQFDKLLKNSARPDEDTWKLYKISRCIFECGE